MLVLQGCNCLFLFDAEFLNLNFPVFEKRGDSLELVGEGNNPGVCLFPEIFLKIADGSFFLTFYNLNLLFEHLKFESLLIILPS